MKIEKYLLKLTRFLHELFQKKKHRLHPILKIQNQELQSSSSSFASKFKTLLNQHIMILSNTNSTNMNQINKKLATNSIRIWVNNLTACTCLWVDAKNSKSKQPKKHLCKTTKSKTLHNQNPKN